MSSLDAKPTLDNAKPMVVNAYMLKHLYSDPKTHLIVCSDVSQNLVGVKLQKRGSDTITPAAFIYKRTTEDLFCSEAFRFPVTGT